MMSYDKREMFSKREIERALVEYVKSANAPCCTSNRMKVESPSLLSSSGEGEGV
jgi:hypothetical protein